MRWRRRRFYKAGTWPVPVEIVIVIVKRREIQIQVFCDKCAVPDFGPDQFFGDELLAPYNSQEDRNRRICHQEVGELQVLIETRRRAHRARNRGPDGLVFRRCPQQARIGLPFESAVIVVFKLRTECQPEPVRNERDPVL